MNILYRKLLGIMIGGVLVASCATTPPGPPPDVVRLQNDLDRLHADPRITANAGTELGNADSAVSTLAGNVRSLDARSYQQGVYIADKLVRIAEASALARYAERRGTDLGVERERLMARSTAPAGGTLVTRSDLPVRTAEGDVVPRSRAELLSIQSQLGGLESRVDDRGLVVRVTDYMFQPDKATLTATAQHSLDSLAGAMRSNPSARATVVAHGPDSGASRASAVRDYLSARGVALAREDARTSRRDDQQTADRVDIVVRTD